MTSIVLSAILWPKSYAKYCSFKLLRRLLSSVIAALKVSFMPRFLGLRIEHTLHDLISFCVSAVVLAAAQILQNHCVFCSNLLRDLPAGMKCETNKMILLQTCVALCWLISSVAKPTLSVREV